MQCVYGVNQTLIDDGVCACMEMSACMEKFIHLPPCTTVTRLDV